MGLKETPYLARLAKAKEDGRLANAKPLVRDFLAKANDDDDGPRLANAKLLARRLANAKFRARFAKAKFDGRLANDARFSIPSCSSTSSSPSSTGAS